MTSRPSSTSPSASAYSIVGDLATAGYVLKEREGRRNRYIVQHHLPLPETTLHERTIGEVLEVLLATKPPKPASQAVAGGIDVASRP